MIRNDTRKWMRACLAIPCLVATLCLTQVGCGGGTDDSSTGTNASSTDDGTATETDGTDSTTP